MKSYFTAVAARNSRQEAARQEAERLFESLRPKRCAETGDPIKVIFPRRFPAGGFIVAALIPVDTESIQTFSQISAAHARYHFPPVIINTADDGRRLRLIWRFREEVPGDNSKLLEIATAIARWAKDIFNRKAIVCPGDGVVAMRIKLSVE